MQRGPEIKSARLPFFLTMHWAWLLIPSAIETALWLHFHWTRWPFKLFLFFWGCVQMGWLATADRRSNAVFWYLGALALAFADTLLAPVHFRPPSYTLVAIDIATIVVWIFAIFIARRDIRRYYIAIGDGTELVISAGMTLIFNTYYFQYQFGWIAEHRGLDSSSKVHAGKGEIVSPIG